MVDETGSPSGEISLDTTAVHRSRPKALWAALAVVALAAGTLAVTSARDGGSPPALPVELGAGGARSEAATMSADMAMAWITYLAGDDLPALGGSGPAYRLGGTVDEARVRALADSLGLTGSLINEDRVWLLEGDDGSHLEVYEGGGGTWWYSSEYFVEDEGSSSGGGSSGREPAIEHLESGESIKPTEPAVTTLPADTAELRAETGDEPLPPEGRLVDPPVAPDLPSKAEARQIALDLLSAAGVDTTDAAVTIDGPYDAWYVMVEPRLDGLPVSGTTASVAVGSKGAVRHASGTLLPPERLGDYPLIDTRAAIDRLNAMQHGFGVNTPRAGPAEATLEATTTPETTTLEAPDTAASPCDPPTADDEGLIRCEGDAPTPGVCYDAVPPVGAADEPAIMIDEEAACDDPVGAPYPMPEPEPMEIVLTGAERVLVSHYAVDGTEDTYLVPGYRLSGADGELVEVAAVADESLAPTTTAPEVTAPVDLPAPQPTACEDRGDDGAANATADRCPVDPGEPGDPGDPGDVVVPLEPGQVPVVGIAYYVDVDVECGAFALGEQVFTLEKGDLSAWSTPHEGGSFTLDAEDHGTFVGDADGAKTATFAAGIEADGCQPTPRR